MFYDPLNPFGFQHTLSFRGNVVEIPALLYLKRNRSDLNLCLIDKLFWKISSFY